LFAPSVRFSPSRTSVVVLTYSVSVGVSPPVSAPKPAQPASRRVTTQSSATN